MTNSNRYFPQPVTMKVELKPQPGKQESFLKSAADVAIFGGGAGSGKSFGLLFGNAL